MIYTVIKRDGTREPFNAEKLNGWGEWAAKTLDNKVVNWSTVVMRVVSTLPEEVSTKELQDALIKYCLNMNTWEHNRMAGRLLAASLPKEFYQNRKYPHIKDLHDEMIACGVMVKPNYTEEEYSAINKMLNHRKDITYAHYSINQLVNKYSLQDRTTKRIFETPQFIMMRVVMQTFNNYHKPDRLEKIARLYFMLSNRKINVPTPYYTNSLTKNPNVISCCVMTCDDTAESIGVQTAIGYMMTVASAGIGAHFKTRSITDKVRGGVIKHMGKVPYYRSFVQSIKSSMQACYDDVTEILTDSGWKRFINLTDEDKVAQVDDDLGITFVKPIDRFAYPYKGDMYDFKCGSRFLDMRVTPNHNMVYKNTVHGCTNEEVKRRLDAGWTPLTETQYIEPVFSECEAEDFKPTRSTTMYQAGYSTVSEGADNLSPLEVMMIAYQATNKTEITDTDIILHLRKEERVEAIKATAEALGYPYTLEQTKNSITVAKVTVGDDISYFTKDFSNINHTEKTAKWLEKFVRELYVWGGMNINSKVDSFAYKTKSREAADKAQAAAVLCGAYSHIFTRPAKAKTGEPIYQVNISFHKNYLCSSYVYKNKVEYDGYVYCVEVPTNKIVVRRNNITHIGSNSRGGSSTIFFPFFDPEVETLVHLKNPLSVTTKRIRESDFCIQLNKWFMKRLVEKKDVYLFSYADAPEIYEMFYSADYEGFGKAVEEFAKKNPDKVKAIPATDLAKMIVDEQSETGRLYLHFPDEANTHTPFKDKIYSSNLCIAGSQVIKVIRKSDDVEVSMTMAELNSVYSDYKVRSFDIKTGEVVVRDIIASILTKKDASLCVVTHPDIEDVCCTPDHKIYTHNRDYVEAQHLTAEDIINVNGKECVGVKVTMINKVEDVYDIEVEDTHNFYLGGLLVSNCNEISLPTKPFHSYGDLYDTDKEDNGKVAFCNLAGIMVDNIKDDEEYAEAAYYALLMIDAGIENASLPFPQLLDSLKNDRNAGVGIIGLAHLMAKKGHKYTTQEGKNFIHEIAETHAYHLYKASIRLAKELGVVGSWDSLKYKDGYVVVDSYNKNVDSLVTVGNKRDWDALREEIKENGMRFSCLIAHMPSETCMSGYTSIRTEFGDMTLLDILKNHGNVNLKDLYKDDFVGSVEIELNTPLKVLSDDGEYHDCTKIYYNGLAYPVDVFFEGEEKPYRSTYTHKYMLEDKTWVEARNLKVGDVIYNVDGVKSVVRELDYTDDVIDTFDIEVADTHNYVLDNGCVVHNSSISTETSNGVYPVRNLALVKTSGDTTNRWVAPNATKLADKYEIAWNVPNKDLIECYSIIQKFTDQGISLDLYKDRTKTNDLSLKESIQEILWLSKYGNKSRYYYNFKVEKDIDMGKTLAADATKGTSAPAEVIEDDVVGCAGGACTL